ncbi:uncharacterized protein PgNI_01900 [Pyricularia grisea]|uniref:Heterokaryon incompatibility domain-containing protein n=1 Tax=Pyricularia grisea TaxID=148305 RepID=A0A6P8BGK0_PYRGI|nr:uncharacterized protein PgNI_01900 [Pyricularia grisea]TLD15991.1 hypothetical protein PgNI_01900 [Pyricularia grisea]
MEEHEDNLEGFVVPHRYVDALLLEQFEIARASGLTPAAANTDEANMGLILDQAQISAWAKLNTDRYKKEGVTQARAQNQYKPLTNPYEIRVLELEPGSPKDGLKCKLHHCTIEFEHKGKPYSQFALSTDDLTKPIWYTALSYRWGDPQPVRHIIVDGYEMEITVPLFEALNHFRKPDHSVVMWIDQICINQVDKDEKSRQIPLMGRVYRHAINTLVWLGTSDSVTGQVFSLLNHAATELILDFSQLQIPNGLQQRGFPPANDKIWNDLWDLLDRPWFSRLWIIQEVVLSRNAWVVCGDHLMSWSMLETACENLQAAGISQWLQEMVSKGGSTDHCQRVVKLGTFGQEQSLNLLNRARESNCWDQRDKIYGLLGIIRASWVRVDYNRTYTVGRLYRDVAAEALQRHELMLASALQSVDHDYNETLTPVKDCEHFERGSLPSWVADWSQPRQTASLSDRTGVYGNPTAIGSNYALQRQISIHEDKLHVKGRIFDTVMEMTEVMRKPDISYHDPRTSNKEVLVGCVEIASKSKSYPGSTSVGVFEAFWRTLVVDKDADNRQRAPSSFEEIFSLILDESTGQHPSLPGQTYSKRQLQPPGKGRLELSNLSNRRPGATFHELRASLRRALRNRRFVVTRKGYFGLVPHWTKPGDEVCMLNGCDVPYIIRRVGYEGGGQGMAASYRFHFLGESYIHGMMNEEALAMKELESEELVFI